MTPPRRSVRSAARAARLAIGWRELVGEARSTVRDGTMAKIDLSGFTRLSERLAQGVRGGAEDLRDAIDAMFARLIQPVLGHGGDVLQFGGDALVLWFEGDGHAARAASTCWRLQQVIREHGRISTPLGAVRLRMSTGVATGRVGFAITGDSHLELLAFGPTATEALHLEHLARSGQVLVSARTAAALPAGATAPLGEAFRLRRSVEAHCDATLHTRLAGDDERFLPPELRATALAQTGGEGAGDHRTAAVAFVLLPGTDRHFVDGGPASVLALADRVTAAIERSVRELGVCWSATDLAEDGIVFLLFTGAPVTRGDDDERLLRAVRQIADDCRDLPLRIGANRGRIFSGPIGHPERRTHAFLGDPVNLAARLMGKAGPGEVVVSRSILEHSRARFATVELPPLTVKGKRAPVHACTLGGLLQAGRSTGGAEGLLVGRAAEREQLAVAWRCAVGGRGLAVLIEGEPGIGKSTLVADTLASVGEEATLVARCDPYEASTPYWALRAGLHEMSGVTAADSLVAWVAARSRPGDDVATDAATVAPVFGLELPATERMARLDPAVVLDRRHDTIARLLAATGRPMLVVAEDVHWADEASRALLLRLGSAASVQPWLVLLTARPGGLPLDDHGDIVRIELAPLPPDDLAELAARLASDTDLLDRDVAGLVERSGGNPLFLAELVAAGHQPDLPDTVEELLAARIDSLGAADRTLLREVAVLGRDVDLAVVERVLQQPRPGRALRRPALHPFLDVGDRRAAFRHDLMRVAAYEGLPKRRRRVLHGRAADLLTGVADDSVVAGHLVLAERWDDAWRVAARAAAAARQQGALADAADLYASAARAARRASDVPIDAVVDLDAEHADALELLGRLDEAEHVLRGITRRGALTPLGRARLARQTARVQRRTGNFRAALAWVTRGLAAAELLAPGRERDLVTADLLLLRSSVRRLQARPAAARPWAEQGLALAERLEAPTLRGTAHIHLEAIAQELGLPERAHHEAEAIRWLTHAGADGLLGTILMNSAFARHEAGDWAEALDLLERAAASFERIGQGVDEVLARSTRGMLLILQGRHAEAQRSLAAADRISRAIGWRQGRAYAGYGLAVIDAAAGDLDGALERFDDAERRFAAEHVEAFVHEVRRWRAEVLLRAGRAAAALAVLDPLLADTARPSDPPLDLAAQRLRGHALAMQGRWDEAVAAFEGAVAAAREVGFGYEVAMARWAQHALTTGEAVVPGDAAALLAGLGVTDAVTLPPLAAARP